MTKSNIFLLCLDKDIKNDFANALANNFFMNYVSLDSVFDMSGLSPKQLATIAGDDMATLVQREVMKNIFEAKNSIITLNDFWLIGGTNIEAVKQNCLVVFLHTAKNKYAKKSVENDAYETRQNMLKSISHLTIKISTDRIEDEVKHAVKAIKKYFGAH